MEALEKAGLVEAPEEPKPFGPQSEQLPEGSSRFTAEGRRSRKTWPSYAMCVQKAPMAHGEDKPDISKADFTWCRTAIEWGWSVEATASRLHELSAKAKRNGEGYAILTATRAAQSVRRSPYRSPAAGLITTRRSLVRFREASAVEGSGRRHRKQQCSRHSEN